MADRNAEIKSILTKIIADYESVLKEQRERILQMREENRKLAEELETYRKREGQIGKAMMLAVSKAKEIDESSRLRYRTEMQRLREFHVRWKKYYDALYRFTPERDLEQFKEYLNKMDGIFEGEFLIGEEDLEGLHRAESDRVRSRAEEDGFSELFSPGDEREEGAAAVAPEKQETFDLDEVLYPKNLPDLESLCEELGLNK